MPRDRTQPRPKAVKDAVAKLGEIPKDIINALAEIGYTVEDYFDDDGRIKKAMSSPFLVYRGYRERPIRVDNGNMTLLAGQVSQNASVEWHAMTDEMKNPYRDVARILNSTHKRLFPGHKITYNKTKKLEKKEKKKKLEQNAQRVIVGGNVLASAGPVYGGGHPNAYLNFMPGSVAEQSQMPPVEYHPYYYLQPTDAQPGVVNWNALANAGPVSAQAVGQPNARSLQSTKSVSERTSIAPGQYNPHFAQHTNVQPVGNGNAFNPRPFVGQAQVSPAFGRMNGGLFPIQAPPFMVPSHRAPQLDNNNAPTGASQCNITNNFQLVNIVSPPVQNQNTSNSTVWDPATAFDPHEAVEIQRIMVGTHPQPQAQSANYGQHSTEQTIMGAIPPPNFSQDANTLFAGLQTNSQFQDHKNAFSEDDLHFDWVPEL